MADTSLSILGPSSLTATQIAAWCAQAGKQSQYVQASISQLAALYVSEGTAQGVRGDVAFAQGAEETGWFAAPLAQSLLAKNNFAGIAVPSQFSAGLGFPSPILGVRAHIQLLAKVVGGNNVGLAHTDVAPTWGGKTATTWGGLSSNWAADPSYATHILAIYNGILGGNPILSVDPGTGFVSTLAPVNSGGGVASVNSMSGVAPGKIPGIDPAFTADPMFTASTLRWPHGIASGSSTAAAQIAAAVTTDSMVDLANGQLSQMQLTLLDPDGSLTAGIPASISQDTGSVGNYCMWGDDVLVVAEIQTLDTNRIPSAILTLRTGCLQWMATKRVMRVWDGLSSTQWVESCVAEYNAQLPAGVPQATFLGEFTETYAGGVTSNINMPVTMWMSYYDIAQQLCYDEGFWIFESGGCVVYGSPPFIATVSPTINVVYPGLPGYPKPGVVPVGSVECLNYPNFLRSVSLFTGDTVQFELPRDVGEQMRVGQSLAFWNVPFWSALEFIVTGVQYAWDGGQTPVTILGNEAKALVPAAPAGVAPAPPSIDPTGHAPEPTSLQFVDAALSQAGVRYTWGGVSPSTGFDCSGLVEWALQQFGIRFPHYSGSQYATVVTAGLTLTPAQAMKIRGALLFKNSPNGAVAGEHVAISLGDGTHVFQAPYPGAVVGTASVPASYFDVAGEIPGLNYGPVGPTQY